MGGIGTRHVSGERAESPSSAARLNASETQAPQHLRMRDGLCEEVRRMISAIAAGASDGAGELRRAGIPVELEGFIVEAVVEPGDPSPATSVRLVFCKGEFKSQDRS
jgi:hypothetical protein